MAENYTKTSLVFRILGWLLLTAIFGYDAIAGIMTGRSVYATVFKLTLCLFFIIRLVIDIIEHSRKGEVRFKYLVNIVVGIFVVASFLVAFGMGLKECTTPDVTKTFIVACVFALLVIIILIQQIIKSWRKYKSWTE